MRHLVLIVILLISTTAHASLSIVDGSFEIPAALSIGIPNTMGFWGGDICEIVGVTDGITPYDGDQMVKFINTTTYGPSSSSVESQLYQFIDLRDYKEYIKTGSSYVAASFYVNRVQIDSDNDSEFKIGIDAFAGAIENYPNTNFITRLDSIFVSKISDNDLSTWELVLAELNVPVGTEYLCVIISAVENINNDGEEIEFDGHYGDQVEIEFNLPTATEDTSWGKIKSIIENSHKYVQ